MTPDAMNSPGIDQGGNPFAQMGGMPAMPPNPAQAEPPVDMPAQEPQEEQEPQIRRLIESVNLAEDMDDEKLQEIGRAAKAGYEADKRSRKEWEDSVKEWTKLAIQAREHKTYPWPKASNVKYPLLSTAAMQFAARAYPSLVPSDGKIVKAQIIGKDPDGQKKEKADRVSSYMSYQLMREMSCWEEEMDKLLIMLPIVGTMFKKTFYDPLTEKPESKLILPENLVVNYWTRSLETSERISEVIEMSQRLVKERQLAGIFRDVDLSPPVSKEGPNQPDFDETTPYTLIEQHTFLELDDDDYKEPYIVTFVEETGEVLRIVARFDDKGIKTNPKGKIVRIEPNHYYTKFGFIPNPDGSFYDIGFGVLLGPLNESVNTLINQLVDSGSLNNLQSGFIGKGLRLKMGESRFQPGEWKAVNATADDLKKQIMPLPTKEPSNVLFQLMGALITSGKELASVAEIFVGKMPGQNTPATTTMASIEQGMKVFTAVYKRIYRSLAEEFKKLYNINGAYLDPSTYAEIVDVTVNPQDFSYDGHDICPAADPTAVSQTEKLLKAQGLMELMPMGILDPMAVIKRVLDAQEQPNIDELIHPQAAQQGGPVQQPDPKAQELQMKMQMEQQKAQVQAQQDQQRLAMEQRSKEFDMQMKAQEQHMKLQFEAEKHRLQAAAMQHKTRADIVQSQQKIQQNEMNHQQQMVHTAQAAHQQQEIAKANAKTDKPKPKKKV